IRSRRSWAPPYLEVDEQPHRRAGGDDAAAPPGEPPNMGGPGRHPAGRERHELDTGNDSEHSRLDFLTQDPPPVCTVDANKPHPAADYASLPQRTQCNCSSISTWKQ